jgi:hypothetical protein
MCFHAIDRRVASVNDQVRQRNQRSKTHQPCTRFAGLRVERYHVDVSCINSAALPVQVTCCSLDSLEVQHGGWGQPVTIKLQGVNLEALQKQRPEVRNQHLKPGCEHMTRGARH